MTARPLLTVALAAALPMAVAAPAAGSAPDARAAARTVTLKDRATGFRVQAPRGFKVRHGEGIYTVSNSRSVLVLVRLKSGASALATGRELAQALTGRATGAGSARKYSARVRVAGRTQVLGVRRAGSSLIVTTIRDAARAASAGKPRARAALSAAEIATLQRIAATARGGRAATLSSTLPTTTFVAPDGRSRALVPSGGDWAYRGGGGQIIAGSAKLGAGVSLGLPFFVNEPGLPEFRKVPNAPTAQYTGNAVQAAQDVIPAYFNAQPGGDVRSLRVVANLAPGLQAAPPSTSAAFVAFSADAGGKRLQGVMYLSVQPPQGLGGWSVYFSILLVPQGSDPRLFNTLLRTWQSWDPTEDQRQRIADTYRTLASIDYTGAGPIDSKVFSEAAAKWSEYIRYTAIPSLK